MVTNDTIIGTVTNGSFHFPIEFDMLGNTQFIEAATFDTGCSHSLISIKSLNTGDKSIEELKNEALYDIDIKLASGKGIESKDVDTTQLSRSIKQINNWKQELKENKIPKDKAKECLKKKIPDDVKSSILNSQLVRYEYLASNYKINGVEIGDINIRVAFNLGRVNLIGMHIIKELYTKIFYTNGNINLFAVKNANDAKEKIDSAIYNFMEQLDISERGMQ